MRLHRLEVTAFGPFADRQVVDFDALDAAGLFLVHGATGAGKSSLLDAVCFALYADVPGSRRGVRLSLRSDHAPAGAVPRVVLELTVSGRRLRVSRSPEHARAKKRGSGLLTVQATVLLEERVAGRWSPVATRMDEAALVLDEVLGLGLAQFTSVALLPQGEFAAFLRAAPKDRGAVLEKLFDTRRFARVQEELAIRRREATSAADAARADLDLALLRIGDALAGLSGDQEAPAAGLGDLDPGEPGALTEAMEQTLAAVTASSVQRLGEADRAAAERDRARRQLDEADRLRDRQQTGAAAAATLAGLEARARELAEISAELDAARRAEPMRAQLAAALRAVTEARHADTAAVDAELRLEPLRRWLRQRADSEAGASVPDPAAVVAGWDGPVAALSELTRAADASRGIVRSLRGEAAAAEGRAAASGRHLAAAAAAAQAMTEEAQRVTDAAARLPAAEAAHAAAVGVVELLAAAARAESDCADAAARAAAAGRAAVRDEALALRLRSDRLAGMSAELALGLRPGHPCPVCGSASHPSPAVSHEPVTAEDVSAAERQARRSAEAYADLRALAAEAEGRRTELVDRVAVVAGGTTAEQAAARLIEASAARSEARDAVLRVARVRQQAAAAASDLDLARAADQDARLDVAEAAARLAAAQTSAGSGAERLAEALAAHARGCPCSAPAPTAGPGDAGAGGGPARAAEQHRRAAHLLGAAESARAARDAAYQRRELAEQSLAEELSRCGFDDEVSAASALRPAAAIAHLAEKLAVADRDRSAALALLAQPEVREAMALPSPDASVLTADWAACRDAAATAAAAHAATETVLRQLGQLRSVVASAVDRLGPARARAALAAELADCVAGTSASNRLRMPLASYVLAARLEEVARLANERLDRLTDGRFSLEHTDALAGRGARSGLGLRVRDAWTGTARDTATLSGGESFVASLALALGLADAVRAEAGGLDLQTLFVDEGFGSLDEDSLEQVMTVLDGLREGGRTVGVVSHVPELRQRITAQVRVDKGPLGSTVVTAA